MLLTCSCMCYDVRVCAGVEVGITGVWTHGFVLARPLSTPQATPSAVSCFSYFWNRVSCLCLEQPGLWSSYLCFLHSWDGRQAPSHPAFYWFRWGHLNFFLGWPWNLIIPSSASQISGFMMWATTPNLMFELLTFYAVIITELPCLFSPAFCGTVVWP
jgi:hypothetical protein